MTNRVTGRNLLIIDDDRELSAEIRDYFISLENSVTLAESISEAKECLESGIYDAVILDIMLPDGEGISILEGGGKLPPVIILSVLSDEENMLSGLSLGAADYVVKPCSPRLLEMRISLRLLPRTDSILTLHGLSINSNDRTLSFEGRHIGITASEFNILWFLMKNAGNFFSSNDIYENVWGEKSLEQTSIKFHISNLRRKLNLHTGKRLIVTEFGKGYSFMSETDI